MSKTNDDLIRKADASQDYSQDKYLREEMLETILNGNRKEITVEFSEVSQWDNFNDVLADIVNSGGVVEDFIFDFEGKETATFDLSIEDYQDFIGRFKQTPSFEFQNQMK